MVANLGKSLIAGRLTHCRRPMRPLAALFVFSLFVVPLLPLSNLVTEDASAGSLPVWTRVFHLHDGATLNSNDYDWMNSTGPYDPPYNDYDGDGIAGISIKKNVPPQRWHHWVLHPAVNGAVQITGDMNVYVWARSRGNESATLITAVFYDMGPGELGDVARWDEIARATVPLNGPFFSEFQLYSITVPAVSYTLASGHSLVLSIQRGDNTNDWLIIHYDKTDYDSYVVIRTSNFISVSSAWTEGESGSPNTVFSELQPIVAAANVSNPFGAYDIVGARVTVSYSSNGTTVLPAASMAMTSTDPRVPAYWKRFNYTLPPLYNGSYALNVTAFDAQGSPSWLTSTFTVVAVDHFNITVPANITAGQDFTMVVQAMDASNSVVTNWVGDILLEPSKANMTWPASGNLDNKSVRIKLSDLGQVTITDQSYDAGEEIIRIKASSGSRFGWSEPINSLSGPVVKISITPGPWLDIASGNSVILSATGRDSLDNANTSWTPNWTISGGMGSLSGAGFVVTFTGGTSGSGDINCKDDATNVSSSVHVNVSAGSLRTIEILASSPIQIHEGESQALTAVGYDVNRNVVDIGGATWDTTTSGVVVGSGSTGTYTAGYIPETGVINVRLGSVVGTVDVIVLTAVYGPWLTEIPVQIRNEDSGSWEFSLTGYWHDINGTNTLVWWVEGVNASLYIVSHDPLSNAIMRFFTQPNQYGQDQFILWVVDPTGYRAFQTLTVRIIAVNDKPVFKSDTPTKLYVRYDTPYTFDYTYYVWDVDNLKTELTMSSTSSYIFFDGLIATFIYPQRQGEESYFEFVSLLIRDLADSSSLQIVVMVTDDNPPSLNGSLPDVTILEGTVNHPAFDLDDYFFDIDSDYLVYTHGFEHITVSINETSHVVYISALEEWSGTTEGTFTATDPVGAIKVDSIVVTVIAVNDAPQVTSPGTIHVRYDVPYQLPLSPYVYDPDNSMDTLTFSFSDTHVSHTTTVTGSHVLQMLFPPSLVGPVYGGPYTVSVTMIVSDPEGENDDCVFDVLVTDNFPPVVSVPNPDQLYYSFSEDGYLNNSLRLYDLFSDPDDLSLTFQISGAQNVKATVYSNGVVNLTASRDWYGTEILTIKAIDPHGAWAFVQAYVTVTEVNDAPVIFDIPDIINKGYPRTAYYPIFMYVYDCDNPYSSLIVTASAPSGSVYVVGNYLYVSLPDGQDVITVTLQASDGELTSNSVSFKVGVSKTTAEKIGWPYTFPLVLLAAGVAAYFFMSRIPRPYALENLFLIHNDGRLIAHVTKEENTTLDKDVVSAMFTAVQDFVRDSFQKGEVGLKKLEIGDKNVVIEKGQSAYLALIYSGWPSKETFSELPMLLRDIEERYKGRLERWNGTGKTVKGVDKMLQDYMANAFKPGVWHEEEEIAEAEWVDILEKEA